MKYFPYFFRIFSAAELFTALALFNQLAVCLSVFPVTVPIFIKGFVSRSFYIPFNPSSQKNPSDHVSLPSYLDLRQWARPSASTPALSTRKTRDWRRRTGRRRGMGLIHYMPFV